MLNCGLSRKERIFDQFRITPSQIVYAYLPVFTHSRCLDARFHMALLIKIYGKTFTFFRLITQRIDDFLYLPFTRTKTSEIEMGFNVHTIGETAFRGVAVSCHEPDRKIECSRILLEFFPNLDGLGLAVFTAIFDFYLAHEVFETFIFESSIHPFRSEE